jgi:hypothetical protein
MAMFELADAAATRERLSQQSVRVVWESVHDDIVDLHLHPKDVPGAIVALDVTEPPGSWRWGGPKWTAAVPEHGRGGLTGMTIAVTDPVPVARRWASVLGVPTSADSELRLDGGRQVIRFVEPERVEGIVAAEVAVPSGTPTGMITVAGVDFDRRPSEEPA